MAAVRKKKKETELVQALACGASPESAGQKVGLSRRTVYRRLEDPAFFAQVTEMRAEMARRTSAMITAAGMAAVKTLTTLQDSAASESVRLGAARAIIELGCKQRESVEWAERLAALDGRLETLLDAPNRPEKTDETEKS